MIYPSWSYGHYGQIYTVALYEISRCIYEFQHIQYCPFWTANV